MVWRFGVLAIRRSGVWALSVERFEVLAAGGDSALGGDDFDHRIFCWMLEEAKVRPLSSGDSRLLLTRAREAKEYLTYHAEAPITARLSTGELEFAVVALLPRQGAADLPLMVGRIALSDQGRELVEGALDAGRFPRGQRRRHRRPAMFR